MSRRSRAVLILAALAVVGSGVVLASEPQRESPPEAVQRAEALGEAIRWASSQVVPSVVEISTEAQAEAGQGPATVIWNAETGRPEIRQRPALHGVPQRRVPPDASNAPLPGAERLLTGEKLGSGIVVDPRGFILTCHHVVAGAKRITVRLSDGRSLEASIAGSDERTDLAVLKVEAADLQAATLGDSDKLYVGQPVVAIGKPSGLRNTVTFGVVSGLHRQLSAAGYEDFIQTDAAIGQGSGGGPLVNLRGEVVGIGAAVLAPGGERQAIGVVIPANTARSVLDDLVAGRKVARGYLGITLQDLAPDAAEAHEFKGEGGVLVAGVMPDSPADRAGLQTGDIVTEFNRQPVRDGNELRRLVAAARPGSTASVRIWREGVQKEFSVELGRLE